MISLMRQTWHISPWADVALFHFGWVPPLLLCAFIRHRFGAASDAMFYGIIPLSSHLHRAFTYPYAYLDKDVFRQSSIELIVFPGAWLACLACMPLIVPVLGQGLGPLVNGVVGFRIVWDTWHTMMQKFGLLRLYNGKGRTWAAAEVPRWTDWCAIFGWFPLFAACWESRLLNSFGRSHLLTFRGFSLEGWMKLHAGARPYWLAGALLLLLAALGSWAVREYRAFGFRNHARVSLVVGQSLLFASLLLVDPVIAMVSLALNHSIEYCFFVSKVQGARYGSGQGADTILGRLYRKPLRLLLLYAVPPLAVYAIYLALVLPQSKGGHPWLIAGITLPMWYFFSDSVGAFAHYYIDGFIWKLRRPEYRAAISAPVTPA
jgi:hypothetical protein